MLTKIWGNGTASTLSPLFQTSGPATGQGVGVQLYSRNFWLWEKYPKILVQNAKLEG